MYDKGSTIHNNGAKLGNSLKSANGVKAVMADKAARSSPNAPKAAQSASAKLTKAPK